MERHPCPGDPSLGIVNAESIVEGIQNFHMSLEESRVRLMPLMRLFDEDGGDAEPTPNGRLMPSRSSATGRTVRR